MPPSKHLLPSLLAAAALVAMVVGIGRGNPAGDFPPFGISEFPITANPFTQRLPAIDGNLVVWEDGRNGNLDIYAYDLVTGQELQITSDPADQFSPAVSGNIIVWVDTRNDPSCQQNIQIEPCNWDIYGYNLVTRTEFAITTVAGQQTDPAVGGSIVVWTDGRNWGGLHTANYDIYGYDLSTRREFPVATAAGPERRPATDGRLVIWNGSAPGGGSGIPTYDVASGVYGAIPVTGGGGAFALSGNFIVWQADYSSYQLHRGTVTWSVIYAFNRATQTQFALTTEVPEQGTANSPSLSGDIAVWSEKGAINGYDLATGRGFVVSSATGTGWKFTPRISGNTVVWWFYDGNNADIFAARLRPPYRTYLPSVVNRVPQRHEGSNVANHYAIRLQRAAIQHWKVEVPWARAGEVTVANGGDIAKEAGLFPAEALVPEGPP